MFQAMKYLDDIEMKMDTMEVQLGSLDLDNVFHLMWVYKNIPHILKYSEEKLEEIIEKLEKAKVNDFYPAGIILQYLNQLIYRIYGIKDHDEELLFLREKCGYTQVEDGEDLSILKKHIFSLCKPIVGLHTKEVVDIMAYAYEKDGQEDFDKLFAIFEKSNDILIELHLHKVRIYRKRGSRRNGSKSKSLEDNKVELDFKSDDNSTITSSLNSTITSSLNSTITSSPNNDDTSFNLSRDIEKLNINGDTSEIADKKPFHCPEENHLKQAKDLLLSFNNPSLKFYIENLALYLSLEYDEEIFIKFITFTTGGYKSICASKIFRMTKVPEDKLFCLISAMEGVEKDILKSEGLIVNPQTLKMYVEWCISSFRSLSIALVSDYIDISRLYISFAKEYNHSSMFKIFKLLWDCNVVKVEEQVKLHLIDSLTSIFEIFYTDQEGECPSEVFDSINNFIDKQADTKSTLRDIITQISSTHIYRRSFLRHISVLKYFDQDFRNQVMENLLSSSDLDWRYRKDLLEGCFENYKALGLDCKQFLDVFTKDKVFYVRVRAKEIKQEIEK